jgi:CheY-like chemotaxis protein
LLQLTAGVHELAAEAERTQLPHAVLLAGGLEAFLRKICEQPAELRGSGVDTIAAALELIPALLRPGSSARLSDSPWRFLVVDDDPVSRRATSGSLQLTFGRPENADSGSAALALAEALTALALALAEALTLLARKGLAEAALAADVAALDGVQRLLHQDRVADGIKRISPLTLHFIYLFKEQHVLQCQPQQIGDVSQIVYFIILKFRCMTAANRQNS